MQTQKKKNTKAEYINAFQYPVEYKKAGRPIHSTVELKKRIASLNTQVHYRNHKLKEKSARIVELLKENKELKYQLEQATSDLDITRTLINGYVEERLVEEPYVYKRLNRLYNEGVKDIESGNYVSANSGEELHEQIVKQFKKDNLFVTLKKWITKTK